VLVVAACGTPTPTSSGLPSGGTASAAAVSGSASPPGGDPFPAAGAGDAYVVTILETPEGTPADDLRIERVTATGARHPIATLTDVTGQLPEGTQIETFEPSAVSPLGWLALPLGHGDESQLLIVDLRDPGRAPVVVPGGPAAWGPDGRLAILDELGAIFLDPVRGSRVVATVPDEVSVATTWAADGSGLLAARPGTGDASIAGTFTPDARFVDGARPAYSTTGVDLPFGADGTFVGDGISEGPDRSESLILEPAEGGGLPIVWLKVSQPGSDAIILDHAWDSKGTGLWVLLARPGSASLAHLAGPGKQEERARFDVTEGAAIVGVDAGGDAVVVSIDATDAAPAAILRIDTATGATVHLEGAGGAPTFAGWAVVP
jgi:hypothetical protein